MDSGPSGDGRGLLRLKYLNKAIISQPRKHSSKVQRFIAGHVCCMHARNDHAEGSRVSVLIFMNKIL